MPRPLITTQNSAFTFYDIESLSNAFTLCAYTPARPNEAFPTLDVFLLLDTQAMLSQLDGPALVETICQANPSMPKPQVNVHDLSTAAGAYALGRMVGVSTAENVCDPNSYSSIPAALRPVCDTDTDYNSMTHPFLAGYNSTNYDTTMLAYYFGESFPIDPAVQPGEPFQPTTAATLRRYNDVLFTQHIKFMPKALGWDSKEAAIRNNMLRSGRHIDVSQFNELQSKTALKRQLGMLGRQILESDKLGHDSVIETVEDLYELLAYNVSDCVGLAHLFADPTYSNAFDLKSGLIMTYDETRFSETGTVRRDRLRVDSTSAKLVARILAPSDVLEDMPVVSFDYPHPEVAAERGVPVTNVLNDTEAFFREHIADPDDPNLTETQAAAWAKFAPVLEFYRDIEGRNFNDSDHYREIFGGKHDSHVLKEIAKRPLNVPYFRADGSDDSCFVTFSTGGIHGAESNIEALHEAGKEYSRQQVLIDLARHCFATPADFLAEAKAQYERIALDDDVIVEKSKVLIGSTPEKVRYRKPKSGDSEEAITQRQMLEAAQAQCPDPVDLLMRQASASTRYDVTVVMDMLGTVTLPAKVVLTSNRKEFRTEPNLKRPELFPTAKNSEANTINKQFLRTSAGLVVHEDFTSYYPNLLRNMRAFYNPALGEDRYAKIFFQKEELGAQLKDKTLNPIQREALTNARNGTKLVLNSASGAGDATFDNPIRMNNTIIAMRIIGQLLTWRIGQAQTLAGGRIISTNTDGLYSVIDHAGRFTEAQNNLVLQQQQAAIGVDIEPELMFLISKDSNNRMELSPAKGAAEINADDVLDDDGTSFNIADLQISAAGGGSLAAYDGPLMSKSLSHPAVIDATLAGYLRTIVEKGESALTEDFDEDLGRRLVTEAIDHQDPVQTLRLFQTMIAASRSSITYPFAVPISDQPQDPDQPEAQADEADDNAEQTEQSPLDSENDSEHASGPKTSTVETLSTDASEAIPLQMYNRVFIVKPGTPGAVNLHMAAASSVSANVQASRAKNARQITTSDPLAAAQLTHHGWTSDKLQLAENPALNEIPSGRDVVVRKISGISPTWPMLIVNDDLHCLPPARQHEIIESLDTEIYLSKLAATYTESWRNV